MQSEVVAQGSKPLAHSALLLEQCARRRGTTSQAGFVEGSSASEHRLLDLRGDHRAGAAEVFTNLLNLRNYASEKIEVALQ